MAPDDVEARLLGEARTMGRRDVSAKASVSLRSAQKFWHALGFPNVGDEDVFFTGADVIALQSVADLVRSDVLDEPTALAMTRALARTTDRLAVWQTQLIAEALGELSAPAQTADGSDGGALPDPTRAVPDPATARATAVKLADIAGDLELLLAYSWRRQLAAAISRMISDSQPTQDQKETRVHD